MTTEGVINGGLDSFRAASEGWEDPEVVRPDYAKEVLGGAKIRRIPAVDGPFDGVDLTVPPNASQVILPAAFGDGDMKGRVIYELRDGVMVYVGQPDQTDPAHTDDEERPTLVLPGDQPPDPDSIHLVLP